MLDIVRTSQQFLALEYVRDDSIKEEACIWESNCYGCKIAIVEKRLMR